MLMIQPQNDFKNTIVRTQTYIPDLKGYKLVEEKIGEEVDRDDAFGENKSSIKIIFWDEAEMANLPPGTINMEYNVSQDQIMHAIQDVMRIMREYKTKHNLQRTKPIIVRPVGADRMGYLSPTLGRQSFFVDIPYDKSDSVETKMFLDIESMFLMKYRARVSYARLFWDQKRVLDSFDYKNHWMNAKHQMDPLNMFSTDFSDTLTSGLEKKYWEHANS